MKYIAKHIGLIIVTAILLIFLLQWILRIYTNHGQKLILPSYLDMPLEDAEQKAADESFRIIPNDSIFVVNKPGGIILSQNPDPDAVVKEGRKVYVTLTKYNADQIKVERLPLMYGKDFERKKKELKIAFEIEAEVAEYRFDPGPPNYILAVLYEQDTIISARGRDHNYEIPKGATLRFVISKEDGASLTVPDLICMGQEEAAFLLSTLKLNVEAIDAPESNEGELYVVRQEPRYDPQAKITMGDTIKVWLSPYKLVDCDPNESN